MKNKHALKQEIYADTIQMITKLALKKGLDFYQQNTGINSQRVEFPLQIIAA